VEEKAKVSIKPKIWHHLFKQLLFFSQEMHTYIVSLINTTFPCNIHTQKHKQTLCVICMTPPRASEPCVRSKEVLTAVTASLPSMGSAKGCTLPLKKRWS
jgi:hypothetical protein